MWKRNKKAMFRHLVRSLLRPQPGCPQRLGKTKDSQNEQDHETNHEQMLSKISPQIYHVPPHTQLLN